MATVWVTQLQNRVNTHIQTIKVGMMALNRNHYGTFSKLPLLEAAEWKYFTCLKKNTFTKIPFEGCAVEGSPTNTFVEGVRAQYSSS